MIVRKVSAREKKVINDIVTIHMDTFPGFFLTFMGRGFLNQMYRSYCEHAESSLLVAEENGQSVGFLAYSENSSGLYKFMLKTRLLPFGWYGVRAFFRRPSALGHIIGAFLKPGESKRSEKYIELTSIGVTPKFKAKGIGSSLMNELKRSVDFKTFSYIALTTDAVSNEYALRFYKQNGFLKERAFETKEGRKMIEFRFSSEVSA